VGAPWRIGLLAGWVAGVVGAALETAWVVYRWRPVLSSPARALEFALVPCLLYGLTGALLGAGLGALGSGRRGEELHGVGRALGAVVGLALAYAGSVAIFFGVLAPRTQSPRGHAILAVAAALLVALGGRLGGRVCPVPVRRIADPVRWLAIASLAILIVAGSILGGLRVWGGGGEVGHPGQASLLLVTIDTLRADALGCYGNRPDRSRHIDRIAREGLRFAAAYTPIVCTDPSHATMLTSLRPARHGLLRNGQSLARGVSTLAEHVDRHGFDTFAAVSVEHLNGDISGLDRGFRTFRDRSFWDRFVRHSFQRLWNLMVSERDPGQPVGHERHGALTTDTFLAWWADHGDRPFFAWVHLFDPHRPYLNPAEASPELVEALPPEWREPLRASDHAEADPVVKKRLYAAEVALADAQVGRMLGALEARGRLDDTLVIVVGDHGEHHDEARLPSTMWFGHTHVYEETARVPWVVRLPGVVPAGAVVEAPVSIVDLAPTALGLLGIAIPSGFEGRNLLDRAASSNRAVPPAIVVQSNPQTAVHTWGVRQGEWKLVTGEDRQPQALYHLPSDPAETVNRIAEHPDVAALLRARLEGWLGESGGSAAEPRSQSPEHLEMLRLLGYVE
jgi:arylsulfatase A-like enzyme